MADRFPSLDEIDAGQTEARGESNFDLVGDSADGDDFLSRERAALGDDANQFASPSDNFGATVEDGDDDLLGGGDSYEHSDNAEAMSFGDAFPAIDTSNDHMGPGGTFTGTSVFPGASAFETTPSYNYQTEEPESAAQAEWAETQAKRIQTQREKSKVRHEATTAAALEDIEAMVDAYEKKRDKMIAATQAEVKKFHDERENTIAGGTSWERITKLVDLSGKGAQGGGIGSGKERFREVLRKLEKDENAPSAIAY